jgi:site-specific DNA-adenine methylase
MEETKMNNELIGSYNCPKCSNRIDTGKSCIYCDPTYWEDYRKRLEEAFSKFTKEQLESLQKPVKQRESEESKCSCGDCKKIDKMTEWILKNVKVRDITEKGWQRLKEEYLVLHPEDEIK